jgi:hypothetical protein
VDLSTPESARVIKRFVVTEGSAVSVVHPKGSRLYALGTTLLGMLDKGPIISGSGFDGTHVSGVDSGGGMHIVDVSDPARPKTAQSVALPGRPCRSLRPCAGITSTSARRTTASS